MKLEQSFEVAAPLDRVWAALIDVERVAPCLPGADISGRNEDGSYNGTFRVKIGPTAAAYAGKLEMEKIDETGRTATLQAQGTDRRGQGGAKATIFSAVKEAGPGTTLVEVITEYHITGRLARFGRGGMIEEISNRLLREFASSLQEMLAAPAEEGAYETFVGMSAVKPEAAEAPAASSPASESRTTEPAAEEPAGEEKPKRRARRDLAAAADAVAAASQPPAAAEPPVVAEPPVAPEPEAVEAVAEEELAAVVPEASEESEPPPAAEIPEPVPSPAPEPEVPEPAPVPEPEVPEVTPPPTPEPPPPPPTPEPPPPPPPPAAEGEPLDGLALGRTIIFDRIKRNPAPLIVLLLALLLLGRSRRRRS